MELFSDHFIWEIWEIQYDKSEIVNHCCLLWPYLDHLSGWNVFYSASQSLTLKLCTCYEAHIKYFFLHEHFTTSLMILILFAWISRYFTNIQNLWQWFSNFFPSQFCLPSHDVSSHVMAPWTISLMFPWPPLFWSLPFHSCPLPPLHIAAYVHSFTQDSSIN